MSMFSSLLKGRSLRLGPSSPNSQDSALGLMHLRKLYVELCCTAQPLSQKEQEDKLYMMLPLFCKVRFRSSLLVRQLPSNNIPNYILDRCQHSSTWSCAARLNHSPRKSKSINSTWCYHSSARWDSGPVTGWAIIFPITFLITFLTIARDNGQV